MRSVTRPGGLTFYWGWRPNMLEGPFQPFHRLVIPFIAALRYGAPFLAGYFLSRNVEMKKLKGLVERIGFLIGSSFKNNGGQASDLRLVEQLHVTIHR